LYKILANTLFIGKKLIFMPECHSTNTLGLELCQQSHAPEGTLVITDRQTSGRGQRGNTWESHPGMNLTFSLILKPTFLAIKDQFLLSMITSLAIRDYLATMCSDPVVIKWPNDILIKQLKICGTLIENQLTGEQFSYAVIGIGLNVNQKQFNNPMATSLSLIVGKSFELQEVLEGLLSHLESRYLQLRQGSAQQVKEDYLKYLYRFNEHHAFQSGDDQFWGKILGISEQGRLRVLIHDQEKDFGIKEISFVD
jgi:BirA family transcriptional regulator, biotin operon repressor / biotin---[acetyl-CoA-carboxylase] ligase